MRMRYAIPLVVFVVLAAALGIGLTLKPNEVPSALVGKPVPGFTLPPLDHDTRGFSDQDLKSGKPIVLNVFASWCAPCRVEHPQLMKLAEAGYAVYGIAYKDKPEQARLFLERLGNPFAAIGADLNGRVSIDWGVYGVPETFIISPDGQIIYRHVGAIMPDDLDEKFLPLLRQVQS